MADEEDLGWFLELPTYEFPALGDEAREPGPPPAAGEAAWRLWLNYDAGESDELFEEYFARLLGEVDAAGIRELIIGGWGYVTAESTEVVVQTLVEAADRLPALRGIAIGDVPPDEAEISWIRQSDITPLLTAFPRLAVLEIRGGDGLVLRPVRHEGLRVLRIESGGLPGEVVRALGEAELPNLERLELWLGVAEYGGEWRPADLKGLLSGERLPALSHLGLQDSDIQDQVAELVAGAPVVKGLESLALSMGTLTDRGAEALLAGLGHLRELDLHHHYLTDGMVERLRAALPGVALDVSEQLSSDEDGYSVAVAE